MDYFFFSFAFFPLCILQKNSFLHFLTKITLLSKRYQFRFVFYRLPVTQVLFQSSSVFSPPVAGVSKKNFLKDLVIVFSWDNTFFGSWTDLDISSIKAFVFTPLEQDFGNDIEHHASSKSSFFRYLLPCSIWRPDKGFFSRIESQNFMKKSMKKNSKILFENKKKLENFTKDLAIMVNEFQQKDDFFQDCQPPFFWNKDRTMDDSAMTMEKKHSSDHSSYGACYKSTPKDVYLSAVQSALDEIENGGLEKIVISAIDVLDFSAENKRDEGGNLVLQAFIGALDCYEEAMVTLFSSPCLGTWVIASPEILVETFVGEKEEDLRKSLPYFCTFSLAGTQPLLKKCKSSEVFWTEKEIEEQAMVSRNIVDAFKSLRLREYLEVGPKTIQAGSLLHLASKFIVDMNAHYGVKLVRDMVCLLHPTSAVVGHPRQKAFSLIKRLEYHERGCYTGYFGPIGLNFEDSTQNFLSINLFVNLRSMQYFNAYVIFYAGAGIIRGSIPQKEWQECQFKWNALGRFFEKKYKGIKK